jgi:hypothetical protein
MPEQGSCQHLKGDHATTVSCARQGSLEAFRGYHLTLWDRMYGLAYGCKAEKISCAAPYAPANMDRERVVLPLPLFLNLLRDKLPQSLLVYLPHLSHGKGINKLQPFRQLENRNIPLILQKTAELFEG